MKYRSHLIRRSVERERWIVQIVQSTRSSIIPRKAETAAQLAARRSTFATQTTRSVRRKSKNKWWRRVVTPRAMRRTFYRRRKLKQYRTRHRRRKLVVSVNRGSVPACSKRCSRNARAASKTILLGRVLRALSLRRCRNCFSTRKLKKRLGLCEVVIFHTTQEML